METAAPSPPVPPAKSASLRLNDQLCFALYAATNVITRVYRAPLAKLGLTYPQYLAMLVLWEYGEQTVKSLAQRLDLDSSTITPLVKRLATAGLIHRERDPADQRNLRIELTPLGRETQAKAALIQERVACLTHLGLDEFVALRAQLHSLVRVMSEATDDAPRRAGTAQRFAAAHPGTVSDDAGSRRQVMTPDHGAR